MCVHQNNEYPYPDPFPEDTNGYFLFVQYKCIQYYQNTTRTHPLRNSLPSKNGEKFGFAKFFIWPSQCKILNIKNA